MTARDDVARSLQLFEGGESDHPDDRGGWTRFGLTLREFRRVRPGATDDDFRALTRDNVVDIITEEWALKPGFWRITDRWVRWAVIDFAINSGTAAATRALQRAAGLTGRAVDGVFGEQTEAAIRGLDPQRLFRRVMAQRIRLVGQIIRRDRSQAAFAGGWTERLAVILETPV